MSRYPSEGEQVVALLKEVGLRRLMGSDGCNCGYVMVRHVSIDRSCHKSESSLRVHQRGDILSLSDLGLVAAEALRQMREEDGWSDILVRYCDYSTDHDGSGWQDVAGAPRGRAWVRSTGKCVYCGKPRADVDDYLCAECKLGGIGGDMNYPLAPRYAYETLTPHGMQIGDKDV